MEKLIHLHVHADQMDNSFEIQATHFLFPYQN